MSNYSIEIARVEAQLREMEKHAVDPGLMARAGQRFWGANPWLGRGLGMAGGAATGGGVGYVTAKDEASRPASVIQGAMIGAGVGALGGQFATARGVTQAKHFGQRQLHGATGYLPEHGLFGTKNMPANAVAARATRTSALKDMGFHVPEVKSVEEYRKNLTAPWLFGGARAKLYRARDQAQRTLVEENMTNLPGVARGYVAPREGLRRRDVLKANLLAQGGLGLGAGALFAAPSVVSAVQQRDPKEGVRALVENAPYMLASAIPVAPMMAAGSLLSAGVGRVLPRKEP